MNITEMLLSNFTTICLVIGLGIITLTNQNLEKKTNRSFVLFVFIVLALVVTDAIDYYLARVHRRYHTALHHFRRGIHAAPGGCCRHHRHTAAQA